MLNLLTDKFIVKIIAVTWSKEVFLLLKAIGLFKAQ